MEKIKLDDNLLSLAKIFKRHGVNLYIVGGFVRNALLGFCETDIDICSSLVPEEVFKALYNSQFNCKLVNEELGTIHIYPKNNTGVFYEHTTFRAENYAEGGAHCPQNVKFVNDIRQDASRRDFTSNALYLNVLTQEIEDFYDGIKHTKNKLLKTVETPQIVFSRDGLRILRMVRIASEMDFTIEENTFKTAKNLAHQLKDISQERFNKEIIAILFSDYKYNSLDNSNSHLRGLKILGELQAWQYVLKDFFKSLNPDQKQKFNDISWKMLEFATPAMRISCLVCDIFNALNLTPTQENINSLLGTKGIMLNKKECQKQFTIVSAFFTIKNNTFSNEEGRIFLQQNYQYLNEIFNLCKIAGIGDKLIKIYDLMKVDKVPFTIKDLQINGTILQEVYPELPKNFYGRIFDDLLKLCAIMPELNTRDSLLFTVPDSFYKIKNK